MMYLRPIKRKIRKDIEIRQFKNIRIIKRYIRRDIRGDIKREMRRNRVWITKMVMLNIDMKMEISKEENGKTIKKLEKNNRL